jgi:hypothetical protein
LVIDVETYTRLGIIKHERHQRNLKESAVWVRDVPNDLVNSSLAVAHDDFVDSNPSAPYLELTFISDAPVTESVADAILSIQAASPTITPGISPRSARYP